MVLHAVGDVTFQIQDLEEMPLCGRVLMISPDHFNVEYVINPHMADHIGSVDTRLAQGQWEALHYQFSRLGFEVDVLQGQPSLPDMVFCANQTLPFLARDGQPGFVASRMYAPPRKPEVDFVTAHFASRGYPVHLLPDAAEGAFEGMGDVLWHPGKRLLWAGYGYRTNPSVFDALSTLVEAPVIALELVDPDFYHLDTCLCLLDEQTALVYPGAFSETGMALLELLLGRVIRVPEDEARRLFACNATCPDLKHVIIQHGAVSTNQQLEDAGYEVIEVATSEFLKAGGSVFCMKLMHW